MIGRILMELSFAFWLLVLPLRGPDAVLCTSPSLFGSLAARIRTARRAGPAFVCGFTTSTDWDRRRSAPPGGSRV